MLTWVGLCTTLVRATIRSRSSVNTILLLDFDRWTARVVFDFRPLAAARSGTDGLMTLAAARILAYSDERWIGMLECAGQGNYTKQ